MMNQPAATPPGNLKIPRDFLATGWHIGIKNKAENLDFGVLYSRRPCTAAAVFTRNNFPGNPVIVGREHMQDGRLQCIIVNSGNSNVATGAEGLALARKSCEVAAQALGLAQADLVLPSSTGVIGRKLPADKLLGACESLGERLSVAQAPEESDEFAGDAAAFARAICTTDAYPKMSSRELSGGVRLMGFAKGAGMIEPNMATMLAYFATDAEIEREDLDRLFRCIMDRTLNRISVDGDTSTSDTSVLLANGASGKTISFPEEAARAMRQLPAPIDAKSITKLPGLSPADAVFAQALYEMALDLGKLIVADGEGARRFFEVLVSGARDADQALRVARSIANSPLVKTAIHGADPNWGRLVMAVGKVPDGPRDLAKLEIYIGDRPLHGEHGTQAESLRALSQYIQDNQEVRLHVVLGEGTASECVWASDLSREYVHLNSEYTT